MMQLRHRFPTAVTVKVRLVNLRILFFCCFVFLTGANIFFFTAEILLTYLKLYSYNAVLSYDDSMAENTFMIS